MMSDSGDKSLLDQYVLRLKSGTEKFMSLKEVQDWSLEKGATDMTTCKTFGVLRSISAHMLSCLKATSKNICLMDPSLDPGSYVTIQVMVEKGQTFAAGQMLKINDLTRVRRDDGSYGLQGTDVISWHTSRYDYEDDEPDGFFKHFTDRCICETLEHFYTGLVTETSICDIKERMGDKDVTYVDLIGFPIKRQLMEISVCLTIIDGTSYSLEDGFTIKDQYDVQFKGSIRTGDGEKFIDFVRSGYDEDEVNGMNTACINIWNNGRYIRNSVEHFEQAVHYDMEKDDRWLLFTNVEVKYLREENCCLLTLRSGHHQGKGVRVINNNSVLGRWIRDHRSISPVHEL